MMTNEVELLKMKLAAYSRLDGDDGLAAVNRLMRACEAGEIDQHAASDITTARAEIIHLRELNQNAYSDGWGDAIDCVTDSILVFKSRARTGKRGAENKPCQENH